MIINYAQSLHFNCLYVVLQFSYLLHYLFCFGFENNFREIISDCFQYKNAFNVLLINLFFITNTLDVTNLFKRMKNCLIL